MFAVLPAALAGSHDYNYVIRPPADGLPESCNPFKRGDCNLRPNGKWASPDGARIAQVIQNSTKSFGTTLAYLPNQFLVSSTTPNLVFEMRGGHWNVSGGHDRYDRDDANPDWSVHVSKEHGYLSPIYYEVYQLQTGEAQDGVLKGKKLGTINPRDRNVFSTTDNNPAGNGNCKNQTTDGQPCWRTFSVAPNGGAITLNGNPQDSCAGKLGSGDPCFDVRRHEDTVPNGHVHTGNNCAARYNTANPCILVLRNNFKVHTNGSTSAHTHPDGSGITAARPGGPDEGGDYALDPSKLQFYNRDPDHVTQGGNCFWAWDKSAPDGPGTGNQHTHEVFCAWKTANDHDIKVSYSGPHSHPDGSGITNAAPSLIYPAGTDSPAQYFLDPGKLKYYDRGFGYYKDGGNCFWGWRGDYPAGGKNHTHSRYCYDRKAADGGINSGWFAPVDPSTRFASGLYPNLNGNYVFLIKAVNWEDLGHGYVTEIKDIIHKGFKFGGCPRSLDGNQITCPEQLLTEATNRGQPGGIVQNGFYLRTPKDVGGGRSFIASAPTNLAFNISYGPALGGSSVGEEREYEDMAGSAYTGLKFQAGGAGCRDDAFAKRDFFSHGKEVARFKVGNADWDNGNGTPPFKGFEGYPPAGDQNIQAEVARLGIANDVGALDTRGFPSGGFTKPVADITVSGTWRLHGWEMYLNKPNLSLSTNYSPLWQGNEQFTGRLNVYHWNDGNNLYQGGAPFTWGYWPTCLRDGTGKSKDVDLSFDGSVTALSPQPIAKGYKYNGRDGFVQMHNTNDAVLDFVFRYNLPETRGQVKYWVEINGLNRSKDQFAESGKGSTPHNANTTPGTHVVRVPINVNDLKENTTHTWRACVDPGPVTDCTDLIPFQVNKGPVAQIVSGDPDYNTNTGNVNYNCSKLAVKLTDPEGHQVRPYFSIQWTKDGKTNVVTSYNRSSFNPSDFWSTWIGGETGYKASGSTFTSDDVKVASWTVNGSARSVPNLTLTKFLQDSRYVPEGVNVTWWASGEDRFGASDVQGYPNAFFSGNSRPAAAIDLQQPQMNYRRHGAPVTETFHKNTRPNLLPPGSTKKFRDLNGAVTEDVTDGQLVRVETKIKNTGETPTKRYEIYDYLGAVRDFEPPVTGNSDFPITVQYNDGRERAVEPAISRVIPNRRNGFLDRAENLSSSGDDRRASYKLDFGANALAETFSAARDGKDYTSCRGDCRVDPSYPNSVYWLSSGTGSDDDGNSTRRRQRPGAVASYRLENVPAGTYDLTLQYFNGQTTDAGPGTPPSGYEYRVRITYPTSGGSTGGNPRLRRPAGGGKASRTVNLPIESDARSRDLHTFTIRDLEIGQASPTITITWENDSWQPGTHDANFGLNHLKLATAESTLDDDDILRPGELRPGETVTLRYYIRANRNRTATSTADQNQNLQRRLPVGDESGRVTVPRPDPKGGTIDIGDAHTFVPYSEDYCDRDNPLLNHTCNFKPGDVLAPWLRTQRGSVGSNEGIFGYDPLTGEQNATFLVQAGGVLSHFEGGLADLGGYQAAPATCAPPGKIDWRKEMYRNIQRLLGRPHNNNAQAFLNGANVKNLSPGGNRPNVWVHRGDLLMGRTDRDTRFRGVGTIVVLGDLTIRGNLAYDSGDQNIDSLGIIVLGNVAVKNSVGRLVGTYYVSDIRTDLAGTASGCPFTDAGGGRFTTGRSNVQLNVQGVLVARRFEFQRYFLDPSDTVADPAENVYYDGRVVANTPPGFSTFRDTASWYEIAP